MILAFPMHNPDHAHRQKVPEGSAANVVGRNRWTEEDYWRGIALMIGEAYELWLERRKAEGTLTIDMPIRHGMHRADYVPGQGPQTQGDATDAAHREGA